MDPTNSWEVLPDLSWNDSTLLCGSTPQNWDGAGAPSIEAGITYLTNGGGSDSPPKVDLIIPNQGEPTCRVASYSDNGAMWFCNAFGYQVWLQSMRTLASAVRIVLEGCGYDDFMESGITKMEKRVRRARGRFGEGI